MLKIFLIVCMSVVSCYSSPHLHLIEKLKAKHGGGLFESHFAGSYGGQGCSGGCGRPVVQPVGNSGYGASSSAAASSSASASGSSGSSSAFSSSYSASSSFASSHSNQYQGNQGGVNVGYQQPSCNGGGSCRYPEQNSPCGGNGCSQPQPMPPQPQPVPQPLPPPPKPCGGNGCSQPQPMPPQPCGGNGCEQPQPCNGVTCGAPGYSKTIHKQINKDVHISHGHGGSYGSGYQGGAVAADAYQGGAAVSGGAIIFPGEQSSYQGSSKFSKTNYNSQNGGVEAILIPVQPIPVNQGSGKGHHGGSKTITKTITIDESQGGYGSGYQNQGSYGSVQGSAGQHSGQAGSVQGSSSQHSGQVGAGGGLLSNIFGIAAGFAAGGPLGGSGGGCNSGCGGGAQNGGAGISFKKEINLYG